MKLKAKFSILLFILLIIMGLFGLFQKKNNSDNVKTKLVLSSSEPYTVAKTLDDYGHEEVKTFTEGWEMKTDQMVKSIKGPVKVVRDSTGIIKLDLYLPDATTNRNFRTMRSDQGASLWLYLDNDEFFIIFPELIDPYIDKDGEITHFRINLGKTGFHSELKRLADNYSSQEICRMVCQKLSEADIVEIEPKILDRDDNAPECHIISISTQTATTLRKAYTTLSALDRD